MLHLQISVFSNCALLLRDNKWFLIRWIQLIFLHFGGMLFFLNFLRLNLGCSSWFFSFQWLWLRFCLDSIFFINRLWLSWLIFVNSWSPYSVNWVHFVLSLFAGMLFILFYFFFLKLALEVFVSRLLFINWWYFAHYFSIGRLWNWMWDRFWFHIFRIINI